MEETSRGFAIKNFTDANGVECSIQKSSIATDDLIWLGCNDLGLKEFKAGEGWRDIDLPSTTKHHYVANTRMHLTREQANELIPLRQKLETTSSRGCGNIRRLCLYDARNERQIS